jgi:ATP-binding cassette subfamily G (WHITE) protein 2 (PDR)
MASRNLGVVAALLTLYASIYLLSSEFITMLPPRSDVLLFQRRHMPSAPSPLDEESSTVASFNIRTVKPEHTASKPELNPPRTAAHISWADLTYDIKVGKENKRILNQVHGWVKPGKLTALMVCTCCNGQTER